MANIHTGMDSSLESDFVRESDRLVGLKYLWVGS